MFSLLSIFALEFFLGMRHATDPGHVIAVTPIVVRRRTLIHAVGLLSVGFGLFLIYHIGFVNGLFTSHPQWSPE